MHKLLFYVWACAAQPCVNADLAFAKVVRGVIC